MGDTRTVAGYFRVSKARDDMKAPELYRVEIERYCSYAKLQLGEVFSDIDYSAFRGARSRPALEQLKSRRKEFSAVIVPKLSRFGRSVKDLIELFEIFEADGVGLVFLDVGLDTSTSQGRLLRHIMSAFAEYESDVRADYFRAAEENRARRGLPPLGWIAYGYRRRNGTYVIEEAEAAIVREVYARYAAGESMLSLVRWLNTTGTPAPKGGRWSKPTVRKFLDNHHYAALLERDGQLQPGEWEAIITRDLWEAVQQRRRSISNRGVHATKGLYLLSGLIECGVCGSTLHHRTKQDRVPGQYVCRGTESLGWCPGGGVAEHRAEAFVADAYLARYGSSLVHDPSASAVPIPTQVYWQQANIDQRRAMLRSALERLVLIPRPAGNPRGTGLPRGRQLAITWAVTSVTEPAPVVVGAPSEHAVAKVCASCGRRFHISNFRRDPKERDGRTRACARCRSHDIRVPTSGPEQLRRNSHQSQWRRFKEERQLLPR